MAEMGLPSGAKLKIQPAPFAESKALFQAILEEMASLKLDMEAEIDGNFLKDLFCVGLSSKKIDAALAPCVRRCLYNGQKITDDLFEDEKARGDYIDVIYEVAKENVLPFTKSLYAQYKRLNPPANPKALA